MSQGLLKELFEENGFTPSPNQNAAIAHKDGPLWLVAGPGSGKTRVLLWRTVNLIVCHGVEPEAVFLGTFTQKAARQLRLGLTSLLHLASKHTGVTYDLSRMYIGTVHSLCRRLLADPRFGEAAQTPEVLDELAQYFHVYNQAWWDAAPAKAELVIAVLEPTGAGSARHRATLALTRFFSRLSEECLSWQDFASGSLSPHRDLLAGLYAHYLHSLGGRLDLSGLQRAALELLRQCGNAGNAFRHVIIDEYQDTNRVQEDLFFALAGSGKNLCVVGDDDQALYRFRGATVENLVRFDDRCRERWGIDPTQILLDVNFRSRPEIVGAYNHFITTDGALHPHYRLAKTIQPSQPPEGPGVVKTAPGSLAGACAEIAGLARALIGWGIVADASQIAFLYPSVKSEEAKAMIAALQQQGLKVYSPRSGRFLDGMEAKLIFGLLLRVLGKLGVPEGFNSANGQFGQFRCWLDGCDAAAGELLADDDEQELAEYVEAKQSELDALRAAGTGATDWNLLDLFYRFCAALQIRDWLAQASRDDEGPACNLAMVSQYLSRYQKMRGFQVVDADGVQRLSRDFFNSYLYGLHRLAQSEYEQEDTPFPQGRIPFLTIHQAKGLEFPVVVLGSLKPFRGRASAAETLVRPWARPGAEPPEHIAAFDTMRMFYVALSRAKQLLVLPNVRNPKNHSGLAALLDADIDGRPIPQIAAVDIGALPRSAAENLESPRTYSYTADYQVYRNCPRQYMLFREYGFAPARTQTMLFGSLVHRTIEDVHRRLMRDRDDTGGMEAFIERRFAEHYLSLSAASSHALAPETQKAAVGQVLAYWEKCRNIALRITDVEVPLTLPDQKSPGNRRFAIHGVVDMVQADGGARLYDIKTHAAAVVRADPGYYREQLNVYAHIWQSLYRRSLDGISIIATKLPPQGQHDGWDPVVNLGFGQDGVEATLRSFGEVVDRIAEKRFLPRPAHELANPIGGGLGVFRVEVCGQCDGRHSCESYRITDSLEQPAAPEEEADPSARNRAWFLGQPEVQAFIVWLRDKLDATELNLDILPSRYVPRGLQAQLTGISNIIPDFYRWKAAWTGRDGKPIGSERWKATRRSMAELRAWLKDSLDQDDSDELTKACFAVLEWGGLKRAKAFIHRLHREGRLVEYLRSAKNGLDLGGADLCHIDSSLIEDYDSGLTKIHALLSDDGLPIYDSRVAAGMAAFRYLFFKDTGRDTRDLEFPVGASRGNQVRNLFQLEDHLGDPRLYSIARYRWAQAQIRLGWIMREVLSRSELFAGEGDIESRMHAFEAALFMVGYDLRAISCLRLGNQTTDSTNEIKTIESKPDNQISFNHINIGEPEMAAVLPPIAVPTITIPYPIPEITVPLGEFIGCWIAWNILFKPDNDWRTNSIPYRSQQQNLAILLSYGLAAVLGSSGLMAYGCDAMLRSINNAYGRSTAISVIMPAFMAANGGFFKSVKVPLIIGNPINGLKLAPSALEFWDGIPRTQRLNYINFGKERLDFIIGQLGGLNAAILVDGIDINC